jgi:hypothetical protein
MFESGFEHTKSGLSTESFPRENYLKIFCQRFSICKQNILVYFESDNSPFLLKDLVPQATPAHKSLYLLLHCKNLRLAQSLNSDSPRSCNTQKALRLSIAIFDETLLLINKLPVHFTNVIVTKCLKAGIEE